MRKQGFRAVKIRMRHEDFRRDLEVVSTVREAVGDTMEIMVDANQGWRMPGDIRQPWDVKRALYVARSLEQYSIYWLEEPLAPANFAGLSELRRATCLRVCTWGPYRRPAAFR